MLNCKVKGKMYFHCLFVLYSSSVSYLITGSFWYIKCRMLIMETALEDLKTAFNGIYTGVCFSPGLFEKHYLTC